MGPFYASIKFKTGEEILCYVKSANPENDILVIENPIEVEEIDIPGVIQGMKLKAWMKVSHHSQFIISGEDIVTIVEVPTHVINFYRSGLRKLDNLNTKKPSVAKRRKRGRIPLDNNMGLISSIDDARELLEEVFLKDIKDNKES
jgi:hypothetical protein